MTFNQVTIAEKHKLIVVDENNNIKEYKDVDECHNGDGILHRAFSIFIFNKKKQLLLQKRSQLKRLWPEHWSNSCCSHPRQNENINSAAQRRLTEELGFSTPLKQLYNFQYHARYKNIGAEKEICFVYIGESDSPITPDYDEISECKFFCFSELNSEIKKFPLRFTPWFKLEWEKIQKIYMGEIDKLFL